MIKCPPSQFDCAIVMAVCDIASHSSLDYPEVRDVQ